MNYKCKVDVGEGQFAHVTVHQPLPHTKEPPKVKGGCGYGVVVVKSVGKL